MKHHATPTHPHPEPDSDLRDDPTIQQLQTLWDGLGRQVSLALARCAARPLLSAASFRAALRRHRRQVALQWLITLCNLLVVPVWGSLLSRYTAFCPEAKTAILLLLPFILFNVADSLRAMLLTSRMRRPAPPLSHTLRTATITIALLLIEASGTVVKHWPRTVPYAQYSPIYQRYAAMPGIQAAYIKDYAINDTLSINTTLLESADTAIFTQHKQTFFTNNGNRNNHELWTTHLYHHGPEHTGISGAPQYDMVLYSSNGPNTILIFHIENHDQAEAIIDKHFEFMIQPPNQFHSS